MDHDDLSLARALSPGFTPRGGSCAPEARLKAPETPALGTALVQTTTSASILERVR